MATEALTATQYRPGINADARAILFDEARSVNAFSDEAVSDEQLSTIWDMARWAPTAANIQPLHVKWIRTPDAKARLIPHLAEFNRAKAASAPATALLAIDPDFNLRAEELLPYAPEMWAGFADDAARADYARFNGAMQSAYFILAVRAAGLMAGPRLGFDPEATRREFFADTNLQPILVVDVGHPGEQAWFDRLPRIAVDEAVTWE